LSLYPRQFRERLGESMEQTFNDMMYERRQTKQELFGFIFWTFVETIGGVLQEHISFLKQGATMQALFTNLRLPALVSVVLILPFMIMEVINRRNFNEGFPIVLFVILWLLPALFILTVTPIVRNVRVGSSIMARPLLLLLKVVFLAFIVWMWFGIMIDQMPCFLGVPNCD
jgi:hypothetical protein